MCVSNYPASVLRGVLRSTFPHTQHIQLNGPWDLQLNSIHLYLWWGGKNASLRLSLPLYLCLLIPPLLVRLKTCKPFMLLCQISCDLTRNIIQGVWQKIVVHKTWSPFVKANYWWWMSARRGQKMQKSDTQLLLWEPSLPWPLPLPDCTDLIWQWPFGYLKSCALLETSFWAAASTLLRLWQEILWLQRDCGFWSINNRVYSFTATECQCTGKNEGCNTTSVLWI